MLRCGPGRPWRRPSVAREERIVITDSEILIGVLITLINIAIHAVLMTEVTWVARRISAASQHLYPRAHAALVMMATVTVLLSAHLAEVAVWAVAYGTLGVVEHWRDAAYFAFVNYTTLGYGDILPASDWRLLGPIAAMNGVLLFGWSTAVIYDVLRSVVDVIGSKQQG